MTPTILAYLTKLAMPNQGGGGARERFYQGTNFGGGGSCIPHSLPLKDTPILGVRKVAKGMKRAKINGL